jgi:hypothetical protein
MAAIFSLCPRCASSRARWFDGFGTAGDDYFKCEDCGTTWIIIDVGVRRPPSRVVIPSPADRDVPHRDTLAADRGFPDTRRQVPGG